MKKILIGLFALLSIAVYGQRTGKDSIAVETQILIFGPDLLGTAEINALARVNTGNRAIVWNEDTQTLWGWVGTNWKDLGLGGGGAVTVDPTLLNGSTNPVENNAIYDRFVLGVDEAADSPHNDIEIWYGTNAQYATADKTNPRTIFFVSDYPLAPDGTFDGLVSNVQLIGQNLEFTGQDGGFNGSVDLSTLGGGGASTDDQQVIEFEYFSNSKRLYYELEENTRLFVDLNDLYQDADEVPFNSSNIPVAATDVQEAFDDMFAFGTGSFVLTSTNTGVGNTTDNRILSSTGNSGLMSYRWQRVGSMVYWQATRTMTVNPLVGINNPQNAEGIYTSTITMDGLPFNIEDPGGMSLRFAFSSDDAVQTVVPIYDDSGSSDTVSAKITIDMPVFQNVNQPTVTMEISGYYFITTN